MRKAIAIDFDGCLCTDAFPTIGEPNWPVINRAKAEQRAGAGLILWTCREGYLLLNAITACEGWGLTFDAVNESLPDWIDVFQTRPRKVGASEYWDDKAVKMMAEELCEDGLSCVDRARKKEWEILSAAVATWGKDAQTKMLLEEMAELQKKEICKAWRGKDNEVEIAEEVADVEIMLAQIKMIFNIDASVGVYRDEKIKRLRQRLIIADWKENHQHG